MQKPSFRRTPLAAGVALALGAGLSGAAVAQETTDDEVIEEIITTGIRGSLSSAQAMKENADTFVDGVTASDISALPDRSVAEALQRVPGVNISRFKKTSDPDRFSVEGAEVIIRGLPFVRAEINGRDVFSAQSGRTGLGFNDISPELLSSVMVFKNSTADMIDGGIAGNVNLVTRKPLDTDGLRLAGSAEMNYGDLEEEASPTASFLASNSWETGAGRFGLQAGYAQSELNTRSNASQITDPCFRDPDTLQQAVDGGTGCIRAQVPNDGGGFNEGTLSPDEFAQATAGAVVVPKGAGTRTTGYQRDRNALSLVGQWESSDGGLLVTAEYLRAEADLFVDEHAILAQVNNPNLFPSPAVGTDWTFGSNGSLATGTLSQNQWRGYYNCQPSGYDWSGPEADPTVQSLLPPAAVPDFALGQGVSEEEILSQPCNVMVGLPTEMLRFQRQDEALTEDISLALSWNPSDNLSISVEAQRLEAERSEYGFIGAMQTQSEIYLDLRGETPDVQFRTPTTTDGSTDPNYFTNPDRTYYWFLLDSQIENDAYMDTFAADLDYYFDGGIVQGVKFGARWADRNRTVRDNNFTNWGALSAPWAGGGPGQPARYASDPTGDISTYSNVYNPFADFQRGEVGVPVPDGAGIFWGGPDMLAEYFSGVTEERAANLTALSPNIGGNLYPGPVYTRDGVVDGPFTDGEKSDVREITEAFYGRIDFGFETEMPITGNLGIRYVKTTLESAGQLQFPLAQPDLDIACNPPVIPPNGLPGFCFLSEARLAEFLSAFTGELIRDNADIEYDHWLPSLNVKIGVTDDFIVRAAASKGISRPDQALYRTSGTFFDNTNELRDAGTLETGALFAVETGNRLLQPVTAWSYDLSGEWYFDNVGSLTVSLFWKDFNGLVTGGAAVRSFTSDSGNTTAEVEVRTSTNLEDATIKGYELAYQQTFDFLPEPFNALGAQATYTYVDGGELKNRTDALGTGGGQRGPFTAGLPLTGLSEDTVNLVAFYETDVWSARLAYNWRSEFLLTDRDDIYPFNPIWGDDTGQLDGSIFYNFTDFMGLENFKVGLQVVNILDEVTKTSSVYDYDGSRFPRTAFRNDRRYTFAARFEF